jgi:hypothetical protein
LLTATPVQAATGARAWLYLTTHNKSASDAYIQVFDALAGSVTLGVTVPKMSIWVPPSGASDNINPRVPINFATGIVLAATTTETGAVAPYAGVAATLVYR